MRRAQWYCWMLVTTFVLGVGISQLTLSVQAQTLPILQPLADKPGLAPAGLKTGATYYVPATPDTVLWGALPEAQSKPILTVPSGATVTFDTLSHEGILEDQGKDPVKYFGQFGVKPSDVLKDARAIAASKLEHDFVKDGPHVVIGPVAVTGAQPGDILKIEFLSFIPRVPYGVISNRHGKGALPGEFPETPNPEPGASQAHPELYHNVSTFVRLEYVGGKLYCVLKDRNGRALRFAAGPFQGITGVTPNQSGRINSIPPDVYGNNLDIKYLTAGSTLYLPVQVPGAKFYIADPHFAQGNGEVALTAVEGSLRTTVRLTVLKVGQPGYPTKQQLKVPFAETPEYWIPIGLDPDLNVAMKKAVRNAINYLSTTQGLDRASAMAYLSAATDFNISEVVDKTKGVVGLIKKADFQPTNAGKTKK